MNEADLNDKRRDPINGTTPDKQERKRLLVTPKSKSFFLFLLFFAVTASSLSLYFTLRLSNEFHSEVSALSRSIESGLADDEQSILNLAERIVSIEETILSRISKLESQLEVEEELLGLKLSEVDTGSLQIKESLKHIQFLLREAHRYLSLNRDKDHAIRLLKNANELMDTERLKAYQYLSDLISAQVLELELLQVDDLPEVFDELDELTDLVDGLEILDKEFSTVRVPEEYDGYWDEFKGVVDRIVLVRSVSRSTDRLDLSRELDLALIKLEWKLYVFEMRLAVLNQNQYSYLHLVNRFEKAMIKASIPNESAFQAKFDEIRVHDVSPLSSDIDEILSLLQPAVEGS